MSNNKSMKLYTEEEVLKAMDFARGYHKMTDSQFIDSLTPIELPSDEEIEAKAVEFAKQYRATTLEISAFIISAKWMRDKIQGGNNEQQ